MLTLSTPKDAYQCWFYANSFQFHIDCCQGKCQEGDGTASAEASAQAGPSGEPTGPPANDGMEESAPEASKEETSEMVRVIGNLFY